MNKYFSERELKAIVEKSSSLTERLRGDFNICKEVNNQQQLTSHPKLEEWCQTVASGDWQKFEERLAWDHLNLSKIIPALGTVKMKENDSLPSWTVTLNDCIKACEKVDWERLKQEHKLASEKYKTLDTQWVLPFEEILLPFGQVATQKLINQTGEHYYLLAEDAQFSLKYYLLQWLAHLCSPSLELEFSIFRLSQQSTIARFSEGNNDSTSRRYYQKFINLMIEGEIIDFFNNYAVLARLVATGIDFWVDTNAEFIQRLVANLPEINQIFQPDAKLNQIIAINPALSDRHNYGRSVIAIKFDSGLQIVYKPKSMSLEIAYNNLLNWLNKYNPPLDFKLFKVLDKENYGWVEFVKESPCKDKQESRRYYERYGMILCLAYILEATDLHFDNIIACGEYPVLIDLETLMQPWITEDDSSIPKNAQYLANYRILHSVLRTGILPRWEFGHDNRVYDPTGLGGGGQQTSPFRLPTWKHINTDSMAFTHDYTTKTKFPKTSLYSCNKKSELKEFQQEIINGFSKMYSFILKIRQSLLSANSPLIELSHQSVRFVFRSTKVYQSLLKKTLHPKFLHDGADRSIQLDVLSRIVLSSDKKPNYWPLIKVEQQILERMDVPLLTVAVNSDSFIINSEETIDNFFSESTLNSIVSHIKELNELDLKQQIQFIRNSIYSRINQYLHSQLSSEKLKLIHKSHHVVSNHETNIKEALRISNEIQQQAICADDQSCTWVATQYIANAKCWQLEVMGHSLYDGILGTILFLLASDKVRKNNHYSSVYLGALKSISQQVKQIGIRQQYQKFSVQKLSGGESLVYGLVKINQLTQINHVNNEINQITSLITPKLINTDQSFDIISGTSGLILSLLALYSRIKEVKVLEKAILCGNHLLNNRVASESGYRTWATLDGKLLTGFSHGAAGIAYALLRLYKATGETRFKEAAEEAIAYERSVFIPELNNWPDFRQPQTKDNPKCMCSWCHGAPGIGLARVATLDILDTPEIRQDIEAAITTTLNYGLSDIDHLCCGNMGRVEFLFTAGRKLNRPELVDAAMKITSQVVARAEQKGHYGYGPILDFHPGFFQGASGIGYQLLRLAYPDQLPSVLLWE